MSRSHLLHPHSFPLMAILALLLGICLTVSSADCYAAGVTDHCGAASQEEHREAVIVVHASEKHGESGHDLHAAAPEGCPVNPSEVGSDHKCSHHSASGADADEPSLYCNCHAKHTDGRSGHSAHETSCLAPRTASVAPVMLQTPAPVLAEGFLMIVFLDPVEKPPTRS